jgi:hypothetical protein
VRFSGMLTGGVALFDVMGFATKKAARAEPLGQIAVAAPGADTLDPTRDWVVVVLGDVEQPGNLRNTLIVPVVKFIRYAS